MIQLDPLLNNPPMQSNNRAPDPENTKQMTNQQNYYYQNQNMPQGRGNPNRGYNPNLNPNPFLYRGQRPYRNP